jgi:hypothetical protein
MWASERANRMDDFVVARNQADCCDALSGWVLIGDYSICLKGV